MYRLPCFTAMLGLGCAIALSACGPRAIDLRLSMEPGESRRVQTSNESTMTLDSDMGSVIVETERTAQLAFTVLEVAENGDLTYDVGIEDIDLAMKMKMGDTDFAAELGFADMFARGMESAKGEHFRLTVSPKGEVLSLDGVDALRAKVVESMSVPDQLRESFQGEEVAGEQAIRDLVRPVFCRVPAEPVEPHSTWVIEEGISTPIPATITRTWQEAPEAAPGTHAFTYETAVETPPDAQARVMGGMSGTVTLSGSGAGKAAVEDGVGWLAEREEEITMAGMMEIKLLPMLPHGSEMPVTLAVRFRTTTLGGGEE